MLATRHEMESLHNKLNPLISRCCMHLCCPVDGLHLADDVLSQLADGADMSRRLECPVNGFTTKTATYKLVFG